MQHRGVSLLEVLFSLLVLSAGVVGMGKLHRQLQGHADMARQRSEAVRLAHDEIEASRGLGSTPPSSDSRTIADMAGQRFNTVFRLSREVDEANALLPSTTVAITWQSRDGSTQQAVLVSALSTHDPVLSGALSLVPGLRDALGGSAVANALPPSAAHIDDKRSAFKPTASATIAFVVDDVTAQVVEQCTGVPAEVASQDLRPEHLKQCAEFKALLLSGTVRFSNAEPPDPVAANDTPLELALSVGLPGMLAPASPWCSAEAQKTVIYRAADGVHREAVALDATPASRGLASWQDSGERFVAYRCVVVAAGDPPRWSGQSVLVPVGWTIGTAPTQRRVCRYVNDIDGSGAIDRNDEHPSVYRNVDQPLQQQNFLVTRGDLACPAGAAATIDAKSSAAVSVTTVAHQP
jgi:Tfp pilus assembly protein PilV